ncbi:MAG: TIGR01906 family membrane protein [Oscillospiraceae bacterium]
MVKKLTYQLSMLLFMAFVILFSVFTVANTNSFYTRQYLKNNATKDTGVSYSQLDDITALLLDYLNGKTDSLNMECDKNGVAAQAFDQREKDHMVDVRTLYNRAFFAMCLCLALGISLSFALYKRDKKDLFRENIWASYKVSFVVLIILCVALGLMFTLGFEWFWTNFHMIFFSNDLWLLDPEVSTMINMFPLNFFLAMCSKILLRFVILYLALIPFLIPKKRRFPA